MRSIVACAALLLLFPLLAWAGADETSKQLDALYARRDDPVQLGWLKNATGQALKSYPKDYGILWRASRLYYWLADGSSDEKLRSTYGKQSWDLGERAVKANPQGVEGNYYCAIGLGTYSQGVGILSALSQGLEGKFNERLDAAIAKNPGYDHAGPLIAKGRYYYELPWPKRDLKKSAQTLQKAIATEPRALRAYLYLAQTQLKDGKEKEASATIAKVFSGSDAYDPPEARRIKAMARQVKAAIDEELK